MNPAEVIAELTRLKRANGELRFDLVRGRSGALFVRVQFWKRDNFGGLRPGGFWTALRLGELRHLAEIFTIAAAERRGQP